MQRQNDRHTDKQTDRESNIISRYIGLSLSHPFGVDGVEGCNEFLWTVSTVMYTCYWRQVNIQCTGQFESWVAVKYETTRASIRMKVLHTFTRQGHSHKIILLRVHGLPPQPFPFLFFSMHSWKIEKV